MVLPAFLDVYLIFGVISVLHWSMVALLRAIGQVPPGIPQ